MSICPPHFKTATTGEILDFYRGLSAGGSDYVGYSEPTLKKVVLTTALRLPGNKIVELGCGPNPVTLFELARRGKAVTAVELSSDFCETAVANMHRQRVEIEVVNAAAHDTGLSRPFDVAILTEVLEHIPDDLELPTLREAHRLLAPGGHLVISVPNRDSLFTRYLDRRNGFSQDNEEHLRDYTVGGLRRVVEEAGFEVIRKLRVPATMEPPWKTRAAWVIDRVTVRPEWSLKAALVARVAA